MRGDGAPVDAAGADWAAEQLARCVELGTQFFAFHDTHYPVLLRQIRDPPVYLSVRGRAELLNTPSVSIVGSLRCFPYGRDRLRDASGQQVGGGFIPQA